jgi:hypothetical protein
MIIPMKQHLTGIICYSGVAAFLGFGTWWMMNYGFFIVPAAVSRRLMEHGFYAAHLVLNVFFAPIAWAGHLTHGHLWLAWFAASLIWGSAAYAAVHFLRQAKHVLASGVKGQGPSASP